MSYYVTPRVETCYSCHRGSARPRLTEVRTQNKIIVEAKWVCPMCNSPFKHGVVEERPIVNDTKK